MLDFAVVVDTVLDKTERKNAFRHQKLGNTDNNCK